MSINIRAKTDYSSLFSSMAASRNGSGSAGSNWLSDYASLKNGSYLKLMKAYYAKDGSNSKVSSVVEQKNRVNGTDSSQLLNKTMKYADELGNAADKLTAKGSSSLFNEKEITTTGEDGTKTTTTGYDTDAIYSAVSKFVDSYNKVMSTAGNSATKSIYNQVANMESLTKGYQSQLNKVGITIDGDGLLSVDEDKFKTSDMNKVKNLFNGAGSFAYSVSSKAALVEANAKSQINMQKIYSSSGMYNTSGNAGNIFSSYM